MQRRKSTFHKQETALILSADSDSGGEFGVMERIEIMLRPSLLRLALLTLVVTGLAGCSSTSKLPNVATAPVTAQDVSAEALAYVNKFRASQGLGPVTIDPRLVEVAKFQAIAMATRDALTHEVAGDFTSRINAAGFEKSDAVENVGASHATVADTIESWIRSPYHNENMRLKNAKYMGMARADSPDSRYKNYWSLDLASE